MNLIVCLDDREGMTFAGRRQSKDRLLRQDLVEMTAGQRLWMNSYSAAQFDYLPENVTVDEDFLNRCEEEQWCFAENVDLTDALSKVRKLVIYRWNRSYPHDRKFPIETIETRWKPVESKEFPGSSHECITREVYVL